METKELLIIISTLSTSINEVSRTHPEYAIKMLEKLDYFVDQLSEPAIKQEEDVLAYLKKNGLPSGKSPIAASYDDRFPDAYAGNQYAKVPVALLPTT